MPDPTRRGTLVAGAAGLIAVGLGAAADERPAPPDPHDIPDPSPAAPVPAPIGTTAPPAAEIAPAAERTTILHVIAHPDDDLFFFNPEIAQSIAAGHQVVGVCVTAAESGRGRDYVEARQTGLRAAYSKMITGDDAAARWSATALRMPGGAVAESGTLGAVTLIFLNVKKGGLFWGRLRDLWNGDADTLPTMGPAAGRYSRKDLIGALGHILATYRPTLVRTMDPDPDHQVHNRRHPQATDFGDLSDHEDHTATALFTWAALDGYAGPGGGRHWTVESYRGYYNRRWPYNLSVPAWHAKRDLIEVYGSSDDAVRGRITSSGWVQSTHHRYMSASPWLVRGADGTLRAFAVLDGQAAMWTEPFGEPAMLGGGSLVPALSVVVADGKWRLFGRRGPADPGRAIVCLDEGSDHWIDLGDPERGDRRHQTGVPVAAGNAVFARNRAKGLSARFRRADGSWTPWRDLGGGPIQEGACPVLLPDGRIEVFGAGRLSLVRWLQRKPHGPFFTESMRLPMPGTAPLAVVAPDGGLVVSYRLAGNAQVVAFRRAPGTNSWTRADLGGQGGFGPMAIAAGRWIAQRNDAGAISTARLTMSGVPEWTGSGGLVVHSPGAAVDSAGRLVLARIGPDARLHVRRLSAPPFH